MATPVPHITNEQVDAIKKIASTPESAEHASNGIRELWQNYKPQDEYKGQLGRLSEYFDNWSTHQKFAMERPSAMLNRSEEEVKSKDRNYQENLVKDVVGTLVADNKTGKPISLDLDYAVSARTSEFVYDAAKDGDRSSAATKDAVGKIINYGLFTEKGYLCEDSKILETSEKDSIKIKLDGAGNPVRAPAEEIREVAQGMPEIVRKLSNGAIEMTVKEHPFPAQAAAQPMEKPAEPAAIAEKPEVKKAEVEKPTPSAEAEQPTTPGSSA